jgi:hypothetical protein
MCIQARLRIISRFKGNKRTKKIVHRRLYTHRFLRKKGSIYTHMLCTKMLLRAKIKAHRRFYTQNLFHRETFAQNSFYTCFFYKKHLTQRNLYTQTAHRSLDRPTFLHAETLPRTVLHSRNFFVQKPLRTKKSMHSCFYRHTVFTQMIHACGFRVNYP